MSDGRTKDDTEMKKAPCVCFVRLATLFWLLRSQLSKHPKPPIGKSQRMLAKTPHQSVPSSLFPLGRYTTLLVLEKRIKRPTSHNMSDNNDPTVPLTGGGDDDASQTSQRSGASLLERIRAQREREAAASLMQSSQPTQPQTIQVPQYSQVSSQDYARDPMAHVSNNNTHSSFFQQAWSNISHSMESGMAALQQDEEGMDDALLAPTTGEGGEENYSMVGYFLTFVRDVYETFLGLPLVVRIVVVFALLYTAFKLM